MSSEFKILKRINIEAEIWRNMGSSGCIRHEGGRVTYC
jgi:hypothetical protein